MIRLQNHSITQCVENAKKTHAPTVCKCVYLYVYIGKKRIASGDERGIRGARSGWHYWGIIERARKTRPICRGAHDGKESKCNGICGNLPSVRRRLIVLLNLI